MFLRLPQESKQASKPAGKQTSKQESKEASKQASKQESNQAIKQVIKSHQNVTKISQKCHKNVTKMSSDLLSPISSKSPQNGSLFGLLLKPAFRRNWAGALFTAGGVREVSGDARGLPRKSTTICSALVHADVNKLTPSN